MVAIVRGGYESGRINEKTHEGAAGMEVLGAFGARPAATSQRLLAGTCQPNGIASTGGSGIYNEPRNTSFQQKPEPSRAGAAARGAVNCCVGRGGREEESLGKGGGRNGGSIGVSVTAASSFACAGIVQESCVLAGIVSLAMGDAWRKRIV